MKKKGFTLMELLVVILIFSIIVGLSSISYRNARVVRTNERARSMLAELANAAKLFNEMYPNTRIYGTFGNETIPADCNNCIDPCNLIEGYVEDAEVQRNIASFALKPRDWGVDVLSNCGNGNNNFQGYTFFLCNPSLNADATQPHDNCHDTENNGQPKFAVMITPASVTNSKYRDRYAWITGGYQMGNNYQ